jgi:hypothetical protein
MIQVMEEGAQFGQAADFVLPMVQEPDKAIHALAARFQRTGAVSADVSGEQPAVNLRGQIGDGKGIAHRLRGRRFLKRRVSFCHFSLSLREKDNEKTRSS